MSNLYNRAPVVAQRLAEELDDQLQIQTHAKNWDTPIRLEATDGDLNIVYQTGHSDQLFTHEYGSEGQAPNAVIRPFMDSIEPQIVAEMEREAINYLFDEGVLP